MTMLSNKQFQKEIENIDHRLRDARMKDDFNFIRLIIAEKGKDTYWIDYYSKYQHMDPNLV